MGKLKVREEMASRPDPRADDELLGGRAGLSSPEHRTSRPPKSAQDLMKMLGAPGPGAGGVNDIFGIVGTTQAGIFRVDSVVAHGGFSVIYKAWHVRFAAPTALKCLKLPPTLSQPERIDFLSKFMSEGEVMFRLSSSSPEVVRPLHIDALKLADGRDVPYIALEWLEGETLRDRLIRREEQGKAPLSMKRAVQALQPVARALYRAHDIQGPTGRLAVLHCDLKPDNIFVVKRDGLETLKVFDFGIAKVREAATREAGGATAKVARNQFTPAYAAPEQWAPSKYGQTGPWTDVFALALTLVEVVTQRSAIDGTHAAMLTRSLDEKRRPTPRNLGLEVTDAVEEVFMRALAVDPRSRIASVERLWTSLEAALDLPRTFSAGAPPVIGKDIDWDSPDGADSPPPPNSSAADPAAAEGAVPSNDPPVSQRRPASGLEAPLSVRAAEGKPPESRPSNAPRREAQAPVKAKQSLGSAGVKIAIPIGLLAVTLVLVVLLATQAIEGMAVIPAMLVAIASAGGGVWYGYPVVVRDSPR